MKRMPLFFVITLSLLVLGILPSAKMEVTKAPLPAFKTSARTASAPVFSPPTVSLTSPANNANFIGGATITLTATAADSDGTVSKVEFFQGAVKLGEDTTAPYSYDWTNVTGGDYVLTAKATDNASEVTTSAAINISVLRQVKQYVGWSSITNGTDLGNGSVRKTSAGAWDFSANSLQTLLPGDGYFESTAANFNQSIALNGANGVQRALVIGSGGWAGIYENGVEVAGTYGHIPSETITPHASGDRYRIEITNSILRYIRYRAGAREVMFTSAAALPGYPISGGLGMSPQNAEWQKSVLAQLTRKANWSSILNGIDLGNGSVRKTGGGASTFSATAVQKLVQGDGYCESTASNYSQSIALTGANNAQRALVIGTGGWAAIYENGAEVANTYPMQNIAPHAAGDRYRFEIANSSLRYVRYRAGIRTVMFTSANALPTYPFTFSFGISVQNDEWQNTVITQLSQNATWSSITNGIDLGNGSVRKTSTGAWDFSAVGRQQLVFGSGYFESTASYWNHSINLGGSDGAGRSLVVGTGGWAAIYENGAEVANTSPLGNITPHAAGDRYRLEMSRGKLRYVRYRAGVRTIMFTSTNTIPAYALGYSLGMSFQNSEWQNTIFSDNAPEHNDASFVSQTVPTTMVPGQNYSVSVTMRNTGASTWTPDGDYQLGSENLPDNTRWGLSRVNLSTIVPPGSDGTFSFTVTAPTAGSHSFQWRMVQQGVERFGALSTNVNVQTVNNPPTVSLTSPTSNATFTAPVTVALAANASDSDGTITKVEFFQGSTKLGEDTTSPYTYSWTSVPAGIYVLTAKATDNSGATATSSTVNITVNAPNQPPTVSITAPTNGTVFSAPANISLAATASDADGMITKVQFFQGATLLGEDLSAPFTYNWNNVAAGSYSLTAKATDNANAVVTSAAVAIIVNASPTVSLTAPTNGQVFSAPANITLTATASDSDGTITKVQFYQGATLLGEDLSAPYSYAWNNVAAGNYSVTAKATDNLGAISTSAAASITVNTLPTVSITSPTHPTTFVAPATFTITAAASDPDGSITKVEFFAGVALLGQDTTAPYTHTINNSAHGVYWLTAVATDNRGGTKTSSPVTAVVTDPPTCSISSPANNSVFAAGSNIVINANASDPDGTVAKVEFFQGAVKLGEDTTSPFSFAWNGVPVGTYSLTARAVDDLGVTGTSAPISINVVIASGIARLDPMNRTGGSGEDPLSRNYNWSAPLINLPGRAGLDLGLSLSYNSLVWTRSGNYITFDDDAGFPSPGFRLGFPVIQGQFFNSEANKNAFMLITPNGSRVELRQVGTSALYEAVDSSHLLLDSTTMVMRTTDGVQFSYLWYGNDFQCTQIKDRNGNFITVNYTGPGRIDTIVDTLGRTIQFNYDTSNYPISITQTWGGQSQPHVWASFEYYPNVQIQTNFTNLTAVGPSAIKALSKVILDDNSSYAFDYTSWGQIWKIYNYAADGHLLAYRAYNLPGNNLTPQTDCPRFTDRHDWAEDWNRGGPLGSAGLPAGAEGEVHTYHTIPAGTSWTLPDGITNESGLMVQVTQPDGTYNKIYFAGTAGTSTGWRRGLPSLIETYGKTTPGQGSAIKQRSQVSSWTQDTLGVSYTLNPRSEETNVYDFNASGQIQNRARTKVTYVPFAVGDGTVCNLPQDVLEYQANATTVLRRTRTEYVPADGAYTSRRIIGLVNEKKLYEVDPNTLSETLMSRVVFFYDEAGSILGNDAPVQHDSAYNSGFVPRANVSTLRRYNVINTSQFTASTMKYNTTGALVKTVDGAGHQVLIDYTDQFSTDGTTIDSSHQSTLAYPTTVTDPDNYTSSSRYRYDFGAVTWQQTPQPNTTANLPGPQRTFAYDSTGRIQRISNLANGSYTRFVYPSQQPGGQNRIDTYTTIVEGSSEQNGNEARSFKIFDGVGRVFATGASHPGSAGGFSGQLVQYDNMGRIIKQSNPTETNASGSPLQWAATGDDAAAGWIYTLQTYDWKSRPLVTTNPSVTGNPADTTTTEASYSGCGCAGGDVVTITDEGTLSSGALKQRQKKIYRDVLGRATKTEVLNWDGPSLNGTGGSSYSTTINTYNARDQITRSRQLKGAGPNPDDLTCLNTSLRLGTDSTWKQTQTYSAGWETTSFNDNSWSAAVDEGAYGTQPWGSGRLPTDTPSHWIWYYDSRGGYDTSTVYFRKSFVATSDSATLAIGADDQFTAYLNGVQVASGTNWQQVQWTTLPLTPGATYVLAVVVNNTGWPGGLIADLASIGTTCEQSLMTYDGYGRLQTRHVPGQDPTRVTTYSYNDDDTVSSLVDARGASQTLSYNNRRLINGISYSAPQGSGIAVPVSITYGYDGAGNRTSMSDGLGGITYQFDQLSRVISETRQFADPAAPFLNASYALGYTYNLAGELKTITDHENSTINYNYDHAGRMTGITGANNLYGSVSQYASGIGYRAWGGMKSLTYGNNYSLAMSYNARLQETEFEISGRPPQFGASTVMKTQFTYYSDGSLKYAHDTLDERFDRAYSYDHVSMLKEAFSGSEARDFVFGTTSSSATTGPYRQSYQHDIFGNLTQRENRFWSQTDSLTTSYANNRRQDPLFHYDEEGNLTQDRDLAYTYDAAGRNATLFSAANGRTIGLSYDGDSRALKRTETQAGTATVTYYLRSSVLGGKIIAELNQSGVKQKGYVFADGQLLAIQENNAVKWRHENPLTGSSGVSTAEGWYSPEAEPDPTGVNVGFEDPYINCCFLPEPNDQIMPMLLGSFGGSGKCSLDGMSIDCGFAMQLLDSGAAVQCPNNDCGPRTVTVTITHTNGQRETFNGLTRPFSAYADGRSGFGLGGMLLPEGFNVRYTGDAAKAAAGAFYAGMATGNFGAAVAGSLTAGSFVQWIESRPKDGKKGSGTAKFDLEKFKDCLKSFHTTLGVSDGRSQGFDTRAGTFTGFFGSIMEPFSIRIDDTSRSMKDIQKLLGKKNAMAMADPNDSSVVYLGNDAFNNSVPVYRIAAQIHEIGNKIYQKFAVTGMKKPEAQSATLRKFDGDAGMALEECVFGGYVKKDGTLMK